MSGSLIQIMCWNWDVNDKLAIISHGKPVKCFESTISLTLLSKRT